MYVYLFVFPYPCEQALKAACIQTIKAKTKPILHSRTGKLCLKGVFLSPIKNQVQRPSTDFEAGFPSQLFRHSTTEKQCTRPHGHPGNAYLIVWKVGVTRTYVNGNE